MSNEIIKASGAPAVKTMDDLARVSKMFADSGLFKDTKEAAQCGIRILAGLEMGFGAFQSMTGVHIIQGKPTYGVHLIAAAIKRSGRYNFRVTEHTNENCSIRFLERIGDNWEEAGISTFSLEDAKKANLLNNPTWKNYPRNMLYSRAVSNGARWFCPDVFGAPIYTPDELGAQVNEDGEIIDVEPAPAKSEKPAAPAQPQAEAIAEKPSADPVWKAWRGKDDPVLWAVDQTDDHGSALYDHHNHAQNSYDKARREYLNSLDKDSQPKDGDSREVKWQHFQALNAYFFEKVQAKKRGEEFILPAAGSQRIFEDIKADEGVSFEAIGA